MSRALCVAPGLAPAFAWQRAASFLAVYYRYYAAYRHQADRCPAHVNVYTAIPHTAINGEHVCPLHDPQALAFAQFINNLVSLDSSYQSKMAGKYEFIFFGMDAASSTDERRARAFFEQVQWGVGREHTSAAVLLRTQVR